MRCFLSTITFLFLVAFEKALGSNISVHNLCFPTATRSLTNAELDTFEGLTDHYLVSQDLDSSKSVATEQRWVPFQTINASIASDPATWFVIDDAMANATPFCADVCWTVSLQISAVYAKDDFASAWIDSQRTIYYMSLLRTSMPSDLFVPASPLLSPEGNKIISTTMVYGEDTTTTTTTTTTVTTTVAPQKWIWLWTTAGVLTVGCFTICAVYYIYLRPSPLRYIRKNESQDGTTNRGWPDHGEPDIEIEDSSCSSFCTS